MRTAAFLLIIYAAVAATSITIRPKQNNRTETLKEITPAMTALATQLPHNATIGFIASGIEDGELLSETRWLLYPRTIERTLITNPAEWDTVLVITAKRHVDSLLSSIMSGSSKLHHTSSARFSYDLVIPARQ